MTHPEPVPVLYVAAYGRSGTTLLGNLLNEVEGLFHAGELDNLWPTVLDADGGRCGCGRTLLACPVWSRVLERGLPAGRTLEDHARLVWAWRRAATRVRRTGFLLRAADAQLESDPAVGPYLDHLRRTYSDVREVTGARLVVDTSKLPAEAAALARLAGVDLRLVHLVRDPRGVAASWLRANERLARHGASRSAAGWMRFEAAIRMVERRLDGRALTLRYEDLVAEPRRSLDSILRLAGISAPTPAVAGGAVHMGPNHTLAGNPSRFRRGTVALSEDRRWEGALTSRQRLAVGLLTIRERWRHGYR